MAFIILQAFIRAFVYGAKVALVVLGGPLRRRLRFGSKVCYRCFSSPTSPDFGVVRFSAQKSRHLGAYRREIRGGFLRPDTSPD